MGACCNANERNTETECMVPTGNGKQGLAGQHG